MKRQATPINAQRQSRTQRLGGAIILLVGKLLRGVLIAFGAICRFAASHVRKRPAHFGVGFLSLAIVFSLINVLPLDATAAIRSQTLYIPITSEPSEAEMGVAPLFEIDAVTYEVKRGDTLATIFKKAGLGASVVHAVVNETPNGDILTNIKPGETISIQAEDGTLLRLNYSISAMQGLEIRASDYGLESFHIDKQPDVFEISKSGVINTSLFVDAEKAGISQKTIMEMANIFGWDIDFALDIRRGDTFKVIYEERFLDGEKIGSGDILAAEFVNQGKQIRAVRFVNREGFAHYYTPEGESMRKTFLRAPVDFTRISSNFNPNRLHPIYKTIRPHNGIDYAAPTGTPVFSSGDGKVIASSYNNANGNYVFIQHGQKYVTKYLHLNKKSVKVGQSVRQGQTIGTVGMTGSATGPHLHYEFLVNGVHMNPRTVDLPNGEPIDPSQLAQFQQATAKVLAMLDNPAVQVASNQP